MTQEELVEAAERTCCLLWASPVESKWYRERTANAAIFSIYCQCSKEARDLLVAASELAHWRASLCP